MNESFYAALGVDENADESTLKAAYRDAVKRHHPDVSDDPTAQRQFKTLTTARDVLLNPDERARYDRLGHETYVRVHLDGPTHSGAGRQTGDGRRTRDAGADTTGRTRDTQRGTERGAGRARTRSGSGQGTEGGRSANAPPGARRDRVAAGRRRHVGATPQAAVGRAVGVEEPWQAASKTYQRSAAASREAAARTDSSTVRDIVAGLGPWLAVHLIFIVSAVATGAFVVSEANAYVHLSLPAYLLGLVLFGLVVGLSILHLISTALS